MKLRLVPPASVGTAILPRVVVVVCVLGVFFWLFGDGLRSDRSFVYRDAAHYYDPLFEFTTSEWAAGRVPLWNPHDGIGKPLLADSTSSVFYPGKLIFVLPLAYATKYKMYIVGHVLLAAIGAGVLARRWGGSVAAAGACAVSYAFCGHVVFQYCNVVFLVGAAWLPLAILAADRLLLTRRFGWALALGGVLALMTLGGDPQTAYHAGLMSAGYALLLWLRRRKFRRRFRLTGQSRVRFAARLSALVRVARTNSVRNAVNHESKGRNDRYPFAGNALARHRFVLLAWAALAAGVLAAVQVLPSSHWVRQSQRAAYAVPRSVYEVPGYLVRNARNPSGGTVAGQDRDREALHSPVAELGRTSPASDRRDPLDGLLVRPRPGEHQEHIYYFSVAPWRLAEFFWPNLSGRQFPEHRRWIEAIPAEGLAWTPTYYMGLLPLLLAIGGLRWRHAPVRVRWLSWSVLVAVLCSFGWYGIGWLVTELYHAVGGDPAAVPFGSPVGGLYWLLTVFLPGYVYFRYPAKLMVVAALGLSLLAARGWDRAVARPAPRLRRVLMLLAGVSLVGSAGLLLLRPAWTAWLGNMPANPLFGPFDTRGAFFDLQRSLLHTAIVCVLTWCLLPRGSRSTPAGECFVPSSMLRAWLLLLVTAVELAMAQAWLVPTAPRDSWTDPGPLAAAIRKDLGHDAGVRMPRIDRAAPRHWFDRSWSQTSSRNRQTEGLVCDNVTLMPRFNLRQRVGLLDARGSIESQDFSIFLAVARGADPRRVGRSRLLHPKVRDALATDYAIVRGRSERPEGFLPRAEFRFHEQPFAELWRRERSLSRVWIADQVVRIDSLPHRDPETVLRRTREVLLENRHVRDLRATAVVEMPRHAEMPFETYAGRTGDSGRAESSSEYCRIVVDEPQRLEIEAELGQPGLLVLSDFYDDGWKASVIATTSTEMQANERLAMLRTNRVMRGIFLPTGSHRIAFHYAPREFYLGALISGVGWLAIVFAATAYGIRLRYPGISKTRSVSEEIQKPEA